MIGCAFLFLPLIANSARLLRTITPTYYNYRPHTLHSPPASMGHDYKSIRRRFISSPPACSLAALIPGTPCGRSRSQCHMVQGFRPCSQLFRPNHTYEFRSIEYHVLHMFFGVCKAGTYRWTIISEPS